MSREDAATVEITITIKQGENVTTITARKAKRPLWRGNAVNAGLDLTAKLPRLNGFLGADCSLEFFAVPDDDHQAFTVEQS